MNIEKLKPIYDFAFHNRIARKLKIDNVADRLEWLIRGRRFNYVKLYSGFNPKEYYRYVGALKEADFMENGKIVLTQLKNNALTPDSSILDAGCGTGRVTDHLYSYLSKNGHYVGFDIGKEAIDYCKTKYTKPNFQFYTTDGQTIPDTPYAYDIILFMSVFTHLYEEEMLSMLNLCKPTLSKQGKIIASFWFSGDAGSWTRTKTKEGNRRRMEYNREYLSNLLTCRGWKIQEQDWGIGQKVLLLMK